MSDLATILIILATYLIISIGIGIYGRSKDDSAEDYFVASRKIGPWILFCTLAATNFSAFFFLGFAGASYRAGWGFYGIMAMGERFEEVVNVMSDLRTVDCDASCVVQIQGIVGTCYCSC